MSPYEIGGRRMANLFMTPDMINFVDVIIDSKEQLELGLEHVLVSPSSPLAGQSLKNPHRQKRRQKRRLPIPRLSALTACIRCSASRRLPTG